MKTTKLNKENAAYRLGKTLRASAAASGSLDADGKVTAREAFLTVTALLAGLGVTPGDAAALVAALGIEIQGRGHLRTVRRILTVRREFNGASKDADLH